MSSAVSMARAKLLATSTSATISPVPARRSASASACLRPNGDSPLQVRWPPITLATVVLDSPWRTSTRRVMATSVADAVPLAPSRSGHNGRVIHVRIVSTPELLEPMLRRVEADDAVVNIVVVEGVCRRPYGHLVLLDVTEEAAHQLLDALEQLGLTESGSVALQHAPFTVSRGGAGRGDGPGARAGSWRGWEQIPVDMAAGAAAQVSFSTKDSSWRRLRHSYTPSVWMPYSPTMESPVFQ